MRRPPSLSALLVVVLPSVVLAQTDPATVSLSRLLGQGSEPRLRAQAARSLGDSEDPEAVGPLCTGLQDASEEVRAAAAQALGTLKEVGGLKCLEARKKESDEVAKVALRTAIETLRALKARPPRLYVLLGGLKDKTGSVAPELVKSTEARMRRKLAEVGALMAPEKESPAAAKKVLSKHKVQGYKLLAELRPGPDEGLVLSVVCLRYPGQQLMGNVQVQASGAELEELLKVLAPRIIEEVAETLDWGS